MRVINSLVAISLLAAPATFADDLLEALSGANTEGILVSQDELAIELKTILGTTSAEQNIFIQFMNDKKYDKALFQWWNAFDKTAFKNSDNGKAILALLLSKNNLSVIGLENATAISSIKNVSSKIQGILKQEFPVQSDAWNYANITWNEENRKFWGDAPYIKSLSFRANKIKTADEIIELLKVNHLQTDQIYWLKWQMAVRFSLEGQAEKAAKVLSHIIKHEKGPVSPDLLNVTAARILFEKGYLTPAIQYYSKISKDSEYWFTAQEEMAWSYIRKGQPQDTLAVTRGLVNPIFQNQVGPETYMLRALAQLKVCDYYGSLNTVKSFSSIFKNRYASINKIADNQPVKAVDDFLLQLQKGNVGWQEVGENSRQLPSFIYRDEVLKKLVREQVALNNEVKTVTELYNLSLAGASATVGYQASVDQLKKNIELRAQLAKSAAYTRVREIAQREVKEIKQVLAKMHIIEAEVIQQVSASSKMLAQKVNKSDVKVGTTGSKNKYAMKFPLENEVWLDELSNYKVDIKNACQAKGK